MKFFNLKLLHPREFKDIDHMWSDHENKIRFVWNKVVFKHMMLNWARRCADGHFWSGFRYPLECILTHKSSLFIWEETLKQDKKVHEWTNK